VEVVMEVSQREATIVLTERLLAKLKAGPQAITNDGGASFRAVYDGVVEFINAMDCAVYDSAFVLGDGDIAKIYAQYLKRHGKDERVGAMLLGAAFYQLTPEYQDAVNEAVKAK
jgi:hypothetical protein